MPLALKKSRPRSGESRGRAVWLAAACPLWMLCACSMPVPNDAQIGCAFDPESSPACPGYDAGARAPEASRSAAAADAGPSDAVASDGTSNSSGIGGACTSSSDCAGQPADYCLIAPTGTFASFCTFTHCTAAACGADFKCCDCTMSSITQVNTFPPGICVLPKTAMALPAFGCTCASN